VPRRRRRQQQVEVDWSPNQSVKQEVKSESNTSPEADEASNNTVQKVGPKLARSEASKKNGQDQHLRRKQSRAKVMNHVSGSKKTHVQ